MVLKGSAATGVKARSRREKIGAGHHGVRVSSRPGDQEAIKGNAGSSADRPEIMNVCQPAQEGGIGAEGKVGHVVAFERGRVRTLDSQHEGGPLGATELPL